MSAPVFGLLCTLPWMVLFALRHAQCAPRMDARARRNLRGKMGGFLLATAIITALVYAGRGRFPLPLAWILAPVILASAWLTGLLKRA